MTEPANRWQPKKLASAALPGGQPDPSTAGDHFRGADVGTLPHANANRHRTNGKDGEP
jgi:hypothetical protein